MNRNLYLWCISLVPAIGLSCFIMGCAWLGEQVRAEQAEPCPPSQLAEIETAFTIEAIAACRAEGAKSAAECKAFPAIRDKYRAERAAYVECAKGSL